MNISPDCTKKIKQALFYRRNAIFTLDSAQNWQWGDQKKEKQFIPLQDSAQKEL
jgi:hypothetical protein